MSETAPTADDARAAIYKAIVEAAAELKDYQAPAQAEALRHLGEAFAFTVSPNNAH